MVKVLDADDIEASDATSQRAEMEDEQRDILGEMEIIARLMITGGEEKEDERMTRADRSAIRQAILAAANTCVKAGRVVLTQDVRDALYEASRNEGTPKLGETGFRKWLRRWTCSPWVRTARCSTAKAPHGRRRT